MFGGYSVSVKLTLINNVTSGLNAINSQLHKVNGGFGAATGNLNKFSAQMTNLRNQMQLLQGTIVGVGMVRAGTGLLGMFKGPISEAKELQNQISNLNILGMKQAEIQEVIQKAYQTSREVMTTTSADNIKAYRELRSVFGAGHEHEALSILPQVQQIGAILQAVTGKKQDGVGFDLIKGLELTVSGPMSEEMLRRRADLETKAIIGLGGTVDTHDFHMALKYAKSGAMSYNEDFLFKYLPSLIQEFKTGKHGGASTAGTVLNAGYRMIVGQQIGRDSFQNWIDAGLINTSKVIPNKHHTGVAKLSPGAVLGAEIYQENPYQYANEVMLPAIQRLMKLKNITQDQAVNALTKDSNKAFLINTLINKAQQFERDKKLIEGANSKEAFEKLSKTNPQLADLALQKQWRELQAQIGFKILPDVIAGTLKLIGVLKDLSAWARENGEKVRIYAKAFAGIAVAIMGLGSIALVVTGMSALAMAFKALGGAAVAKGAVSLLRGLATAIVWVGRALLMNPIGLVITGIGVAAYLLYKNWDTVKAKVESVWASLKSGFSNFMDGLLSLWEKFKSYLPSFMTGGGDTKPPASVVPPPSHINGQVSPGDVYMDAQKVGFITGKYLGKEMGRPPTGPNFYDATMSPRHVGLR